MSLPESCQCGRRLPYLYQVLQVSAADVGGDGGVAIFGELGINLEVWLVLNPQASEFVILTGGELVVKLPYSIPQIQPVPGLLDRGAILRSI